MGSSRTSESEDTDPFLRYADRQMLAFVMLIVDGRRLDSFMTLVSRRTDGTNFKGIIVVESRIGDSVPPCSFAGRAP